MYLVVDVAVKAVAVKRGKLNEPTVNQLYLVNQYGSFVGIYRTIEDQSKVN